MNLLLAPIFLRALFLAAFLFLFFEFALFSEECFSLSPFFTFVFSPKILYSLFLSERLLLGSLVDYNVAKHFARKEDWVSHYLLPAVKGDCYKIEG